MSKFLQSIPAGALLLGILLFPATSFSAPKYRVVIMPKLVGIGY